MFKFLSTGCMGPNNVILHLQTKPTNDKHSTIVPIQNTSTPVSAERQLSRTATQFSNLGKKGSEVLQS